VQEGERAMVEVEPVARMAVPYPTSTSGKIEYAQNLKVEGNGFFKEGNMKKALTTYAKVFAFTRGLPGSKFDRVEGYMSPSDLGVNDKSGDKITEEQENDCVALELATLTNIATIHIKLGNGLKAISNSETAITRNASSWKAHLRLGEGHALIGGDNLPQAFESLLKAYELAPDANKISVFNEIEKVRKAIKREEQAYLKSQRKTFGNVSDT